MAAFMTVSTDPFEEALSLLDGPNGRGQGVPNGPDMYKNLRRPVRGIQIKEETHAVMRVITAGGESLPFLDGGSLQEGDVGTSINYANFLISDIQERRAEKKQVIETFGEDYVLFFGEEPRMLNVSGMLLNTADFNWKNEFWTNYENLLRGTKLVDAGARLYFSFDDVVFEGYMTEASTQHSAQMPYQLPLTFQFYVTNWVTTSTVGALVYQDPDRISGIQVLESSEFQAEVAGLQNNLTISQQFTIDAGLNTPEGKQISLQNHEINTDVSGKSAYEAAGGGLKGVVATANHYREKASFAINNTLNNIKNAFYGRTLRLPTGIYYDQPAIDGNEASFKPAPTGEAINKQREEYIRGDGVSIDQGIDTKALESLKKMRLKYADEFAARVDNDSRVLYGVDSGGDWRDTMALLGPLAFGAATQLAAFGMRRVDGNVVNGVTQPGVF